MTDDERRYDDIINLPHHVSATHPHMPLADRAAQFSAFAALTGHGAAITETARLTDRKIELDEYEKAVLDMKQQILKAADMPEVSVTYFVPDEKKSGGRYTTAKGRLEKIDEYGRALVLSGGVRIPFDDVFDMESELFGNLF